LHRFSLVLCDPIGVKLQPKVGIDLVCVATGGGEMNRVNDVDVAKLFGSCRTIAVVGLSDDPRKLSHDVASYLQQAGYRIIPVNPHVSEVLGEKSYASLRDIPEAVEIVNVFRRSEAVGSIAEDAIAIGAKCLWLQEEVVNAEAAELAARAGLLVVMDRCILKEHWSIAG
jgi:predicted CoA-binding protein